jgi:hypothetical protein
VDPVPDPLLHRKSGSVGNRTRTLGSVARNSDYLTTEAQKLTLTSPTIGGRSVCTVRSRTQTKRFIRFARYNEVCWRERSFLVGPYQASQRVKARRCVVPGSVGWVLGVWVTISRRKEIQLQNHTRDQEPHDVARPAKENFNYHVELTYLNFTIRDITGHAVALWLRHYATNRKVGGSVSDEVIF